MPFSTSPTVPFQIELTAAFNTYIQSIFSTKIHFMNNNQCTTETSTNLLKLSNYLSINLYNENSHSLCKSDLIFFANVLEKASLHTQTHHLTHRKYRILRQKQLLSLEPNEGKKNIIN